MSTAKPLTTGQLIFTILYVPFWPALILFLADDWRWTEGWVFGGWFLIMVTAVIVYLWFKDPALLRERYRTAGTGNQKAWDKAVVGLLVLFFLGWMVIMPLDAKRFGWTRDFPAVLKYVGGLMLLPAGFFLFRSFADNTYLSPLVRVQEERKQKLVTTGVYSFVRHPMYLGASCMFFGAPVLMGSLRGIGLGTLLVVILAVRAFGEEKMLTQEFPEYHAYTKQVRYRLIPFLW